MSNQDSSEDNSTSIPPPSGDPNQANKYITKLINLIDDDKLAVLHTDLARFDPSALQDHFRLDLKDYEVEISHSKQPNSGKDFYVILFNNLKQVNEQGSEKVILAYMHLNGNQFHSFKSAANEQLTRKKRIEEEKRLKEAMQPIDQVLDNLANPESLSTKDDVVNLDKISSSYQEENTADSTIQLTT